MSERGSFVTEYIYCDKCFHVVKKVLLGWLSLSAKTTGPKDFEKIYDGDPPG
jgi:hypothetical protein